MLVTIRRRRWKLVRRRLRGESDGWCDSPEKAGKEIVVDAALKGQRELEVIAHEALHAGFWDTDESAITEMAHDLARVLWKLGYRRDLNGKA